MMLLINHFWICEKLVPPKDNVTILQTILCSHQLPKHPPRRLISSALSGEQFERNLTGLYQPQTGRSLMSRTDFCGETPKVTIPTKQLKGPGLGAYIPEFREQKPKWNSTSEVRACVQHAFSNNVCMRWERGRSLSVETNRVAFSKKTPLHYFSRFQKAEELYSSDLKGT